MKIEKLTNISVTLCLILIILYSSIVVVYANGDDSDHREVGVEWVNKYHGTAPDLTLSDDDALGFYNHLRDKGFTGSWSWGDDLAWESDFEKASVGGSDSIWADAVDFVYFSGHGSSDGFYFGIDHDGEGADGQYLFMVHYTEAEWGDLDLEWIFISACQVLYEDTHDNWLGAFDGHLHGICGFHTVEFETSVLGTYFARYLTDTWGPYPIREAWKRATQRDEHQTSSIYAAIKRRYNGAILGDGAYDFWYDYLPGYGSMGDENWPKWWTLYSRWQC